MMSPTEWKVKLCDDGGSECSGAHTHHDAQRRGHSTNIVLADSLRLCALLKSFPRGILIHPMEDLCLGLLLASLFRSGSFCYSHCSSRHRRCLFLSEQPRPHRAKNQRAIWKSPLVSTLLPIFPSS